MRSRKSPCWLYQLWSTITPDSGTLLSFQSQASLHVIQPQFHLVSQECAWMQQWEQPDRVSMTVSWRTVRATVVPMIVLPSGADWDHVMAN